MSNKKNGKHSEALKIEIVEVTPTMAKKWLDAKHGGQRNITPLRVAALAKAMAAGEWTDSNDAICFDKLGFLVNGQHRMAAVVKSGATCRFVVMRDVDEASMGTIDTCRPRSLGDNITMDGGSCGKWAEAIVRAMFAWDNGFTQLRGGNDNAKASRAEYLAYYRQHEKEITDSFQARKYTTLTRFIPPAIASALWIIFGRIDTGQRDEFLAQVNAPEGILREEPEYMLHTVYNNHKLKRISVSRDIQFFFAIKAWNMRRTGKRTQVLSYKPDEGRLIPI